MNKVALFYFHTLLLGLQPTSGNSPSLSRKQISFKGVLPSFLLQCEAYSLSRQVSTSPQWINSQLSTRTVNVSGRWRAPSDDQGCLCPFLAGFWWGKAGCWSRVVRSRRWRLSSSSTTSWCTAASLWTAAGTKSRKSLLWVSYFFLSPAKAWINDVLNLHRDMNYCNGFFVFWNYRGHQDRGLGGQWEHEEPVVAVHAS